MITSTSGWRKVFAVSGDENDITSDIGQDNRLIAGLAADIFADYIISISNTNPSIVLGMDTRPTGPSITDAMLRVFMARKIAVNYAGIIPAPEIMAYSRTVTGFVYISASHNPIGHNGIKFGLSNGGVLSAEQNKILVEKLNQKIEDEQALNRVKELIESCSDIDLEWVYAESVAVKREALAIYHAFAKYTIAGTDNIAQQNRFFAEIRQFVRSNPMGILCDMNGSSRALSIDSSFLKECGISFYGMNNIPGKIEHGIIPEGRNLSYLSAEMEKMHREGQRDIVLGYMPDCDGDRGNIVYWDEKESKAKVIEAQEVFALSVLSELAYNHYQTMINTADSANFAAVDSYLKSKIPVKNGVAVNDPTSMRVDEIVKILGATLFRAEVGEANVVNLAREKRSNGYTVRILGEGSNGGNITHPAAVRDPINTLFALIKLLAIGDTKTPDGTVIKGLFHHWCDASGQSDKYGEDFTLSDIIATLPAYITTGVSEKRAVLKIKTSDHGILKGKFQKIFEEQWSSHKETLKKMYGFASYEAISYNGINETHNLENYSKSGSGGLKIVFKDENSNPLAFIWMRGSGTEPVFRVMCDVKGTDSQEEQRLLEWETTMLLKADNL